MFGWIPVVAGILGIIGSAISIYRALNPPKPPKIEIPKINTEELRSKIEKITPLSEKARNLLTQALERYNRGELSPELKAKLDQAYQDLYDKTVSALARQGVSPSSSIYQRAMQQLNQWYQNQYSTLLGQDLRNALQMSGLAQADIDTLLAGIGAQQGAIRNQLESWKLGQQAGAMAGEGLAKGIGGLIWSYETLSGAFNQDNQKQLSDRRFQVEAPSLDLDFWGGRRMNLLDTGE